MNPAYIASAARSAVAPQRGALAHLALHQLAAPVIQACLEHANIAPEQVDELICSNALGAGGNPARAIALAAQLPDSVAGLSIDRQCCGGLDALLLGSQLINAGHANVIIAGGVESYSRRPLRFRTDAQGTKEPAAYLQPPFTPWPERESSMAQAAEQLALQLGINTDEQNAWAIHSHEKALTNRALVNQEIVSIGAVTEDRFTRKLSNRLCERAQSLSGCITVANSAVAADGAAFCLLVSQKVAKALNTRVTRIVSGKTLGGDPLMPGIAPVAAIQHVLRQQQLSVNDLCLAEVMEAYAAQAIACIQQSHIDPAICNLGGGALARGHPIGASGAILAVRAYHELAEKRGMALTTIAAAGGLGTAVLLEQT